MTSWHHCTQTVEISTFCVPHRSRTARIVKENVDVPIRIRRLEPSEAPLAVRMDCNVLKPKKRLGSILHHSVILSNNLNAGHSQGLRENGTVHFRSSPQGNLCIDAPYYQLDPWRHLPLAARVEIERGRDGVSAAYAGPEGAKDIEWTNHQSAVRIVQSMADELFIVEDRMFAPCSAPFVVNEPMKESDGRTRWLWNARNDAIPLKSDQVHMSFADAVREIPDFAAGTEILDENLLPGIGATLARSVTNTLKNASAREVVLAGRILEATGAFGLPPSPADWSALRESLADLMDLRSHFRIPNEPCRIILNLPESALMPAPGMDRDEPAVSARVFEM